VAGGAVVHPRLPAPAGRLVRALPRSLRWRLTLAVGLVLALALLATLAIVYGETESRLHAKIDTDLHSAVGAFANAIGSGDEVSLVGRVQEYVETQPFSAASQLLYAVIGGHVYTNEPALLDVRVHPDRDDTAAQARSEAKRARALLAAPPGFATLHSSDIGPLRILVRRIEAGGSAAKIGVGESLEPVDDALDGVVSGFAIGGSITLAVALLGGFLLAAWLASPLRRMAQIAARVDAGDLSPRIDERGHGSETRILADAFDHMLDRLEEAFARQQAFVSDASHELRTPLTAIRGQVEVLARRERPDAAEVRRVQRLVSAEVDRMARLTDDLLLLAHTDEARLVHREPIDLAPLLEDLLASVEPTAERSFALAVDATGVLHADRDRIAQALRNLLRNAVEHTQPGGRIELGAREDGEGRIRIWVDDDGPGIPRDERERVFDRFHRADSARRRRGDAGATGGTGLGLAIVQAIVTAHGGRAWATSAPLGGARVAIELPGFRHPPPY
jgi:two-component system, OmpR family, sensor kinase